HAVGLARGQHLLGLVHQQPAGQARPRPRVSTQPLFAQRPLGGREPSAPSLIGDAVALAQLCLGGLDQSHALSGWYPIWQDARGGAPPLARAARRDHDQRGPDHRLGGVHGRLPIAQLLASPPLQLFVWLVAAAFSLAGALTIAELGAALPRAGGMFVYLSEAYGPLWGFLYGWAECTVILGAGNAAVAVLFAAYLGHFVPLGPLGIKLCAIGCIGGLTLLNVLGVREGVFAQNLMTLAKMGLCAALAAVAFGSRVGAWSHLAPTRAGVAAGAGMVSSSAFAAALLQPLWSFDGWVYAGCVGSEIKRPGRHLP